MPGSVVGARALGGRADVLCRPGRRRRRCGAVDQQRQCPRDPAPRAVASAGMRRGERGRAMIDTHPTPLATLIEYWLGELSASDEAALEDHFFGCAECTTQLEGLASLAAGVSAAVSDGSIGMFVSTAFVDAMKAAGLRLREYRLQPGGSVNCTISADDDAVVSRIMAPL